MAQQSQSNLHEDLPMKPSSSHPPPTNPEDEEGKPKLSPAKAYFKLWTYASPLDIFLRLLGTAAILAAGTALPLMTIVFGTFVNEFNGWGTGATTPDEFRKAVNKNAVYLVYIFIGRFAVSCFAGNFIRARVTRVGELSRCHALQCDRIADHAQDPPPLRRQGYPPADFLLRPPLDRIYLHEFVLPKLLSDLGLWLI